MNYAEWLHGALDASEFLSKQLNNSVPSYITHIFLFYLNVYWWKVVNGLVTNGKGFNLLIWLK